MQNKETNHSPITDCITRLLEIINENQLLANKLTNPDFFKQHYIVIVLNIMFDGVTKNLTPTEDECGASLFLQDAIKYLDKNIVKLNKLETKNKPQKLEKKLQQVIDKVGFYVELARLKLFKPCELNELITQIYKKRVVDNVTKDKSSPKKSNSNSKKNTKKNTNKKSKK